MPRSLERPTLRAMDEQFRILGRERQADLEREARRFALADLVQRERGVNGRRRVKLRPRSGRLSRFEKTSEPHV
jgi:hypothetical protein